MDTIISLLGICVFLLIGYTCSSNKTSINFRTVFGAFLIQVLIGAITLYSTIGISALNYLSNGISSILDNAQNGIEFVFGEVGAFELGFIFAFHVLPIIVFFSSLVSILYHIGIMGWLVKIIGGVIQKFLNTTKAESMAAAANIFVGQTEAPLMIRPYINTMTRSELAAVMIGGFATAAGGVLAIYAKWLDTIPGIAGHLMSASVMSAPAALVVAKIMFPETNYSSNEEVNLNEENPSANAMDALGNGTIVGLRLAVNVGAMLISFISIIALLNYFLGLFGFSIETILGSIFKPLAWSMGIPWSESSAVGSLMGKKIVFTEFVAFADLKSLIDSDLISERAAIIASYALCGFANFGSIGIQLGGIGGIAPKRRKEIAQLIFKAMIGGAIASWLTATLAGILL